MGKVLWEELVGQEGFLLAGYFGFCGVVGGGFEIRVISVVGLFLDVDLLVVG